MGTGMRTFVVIAFAALSAAVGETLLSYAMKKTGQMDVANPSHWTNLISLVVRNPYIFAGVVFLAVYFFLYLIALSWADLSFVLPLTAVSYIFAAMLAKFFLGEDVSWLRWAGTIIITIGILFVALDGKPRTTRNQAVEITHGGPGVRSSQR
jgi:drug/metabolite transporter (DMT)-like permease